jgi:hypothetical protein
MDGLLAASRVNPDITPCQPSYVRIAGDTGVALR